MKRSINFKKAVQTVFLAIAAVTFFGIFCEYDADKYSHFVAYYLCCGLACAASIFIVWYVNDVKYSNKVLRAVAIVSWMYLVQYSKKFVRWCKYVLELTAAICCFFNKCRKAHKSFSWTMKKFFEIARS